MILLLSQMSRSLDNRHHHSNSTTFLAKWAIHHFK